LSQLDFIEKFAFIRVHTRFSLSAGPIPSPPTKLTAGDTHGAASLGGVNQFFSRFRNLGFDTQFVASLDDLKSIDAIRKSV
jgi:hypothetical protein